jgi:hypothetical protein
MSTATASRTWGFMMGWTEAEGDALFRQPSDQSTGEDASSGFDGSNEAMRRLRFPFETEVADEDQGVPPGDDDRN